LLRTDVSTDVIFSAGEPHSAFVVVRSVLQVAKERVWINDAYVNSSLFALLSNVAKGVDIRVITGGKQLKPDFAREAKLFVDQHGASLGVCDGLADGHDRYLVVDERAFHSGASLVEVGRLESAFTEPLALRETIVGLLEYLDRAARAKGLPLRVVVEVNVGMNRAGVEPGDALDLARMVNASPGLRFVGLMGWEGHATSIADQQQKRQAIEHSLQLLTSTADSCRAAGLPVEIISCGGTGTYQFSSAYPGVTEIQAGGGIFGDVRYHEAMQVGHECAMTVLATVTSRPTPTRVITDSGKKTMSSDGAIPRPLLETPVASVSLSAEHAQIQLGTPTASPHIGDKIEFIVGYTDTTTMLHDELYGTRDGKVEVIWPILGRGKLQ